MWTTPEVITAFAFGIAFGSGIVTVVGWLFDQRQALGPPYVRFDAPRRRASVRDGLGKIAAGLAAAGAAVFNRLAYAMGKLSG